jgi:hypothetical protein
LFGKYPVLVRGCRAVNDVYARTAADCQGGCTNTLENPPPLVMNELVAVLAARSPKHRAADVNPPPTNVALPWLHVGFVCVVSCVAPTATTHELDAGYPTLSV